MRLLGLLFLVSMSVFAGQRVGNGGFAAICKDSSGNQRVLLLDYVDSVKQYQTQLGKVDLGSGTTYMAKARYVFNRLKRLDPQRAKRYLTELDKFETKNLLWLDPEDRLPEADMPERNDVRIPRSCSIVQIASNVRESHPDKKKYFILKKEFKRLPESHKAGLVIHEIVYDDALNRGFNRLTGLRLHDMRYIVYLLSSESMNNASQAFYNARINHHFFNSYNGGGYRGIIIRYFNQLKMDRDTAFKFCKLMRGDSGLITADKFNFAYDYSSGTPLKDFKESVLGKFILGKNANGRAETWVPERNQKSRKLVINANGIDLVAETSTNKKFPVMCWQNIRSIYP